MSNHQNPVFKFLKPLIIYTYSGKCIICKTKHSNLHVHHVDFDSSNNEVFNLVPLCSAHHKLVHKNSIRTINYLNDLLAHELTNIDKFCRSYFNL